MPRPVAFDITHLAFRLPITRPSGIDKVDVAYARHFSGAACAAVHYGVWRTRFHPSGSIANLLSLATRSRWEGTSVGEDLAFERIYAWLTGHPPPDGKDRGSRSERRAPREAWRRRLVQIRWLLAPGHRTLPVGSVYLNAAQYAFEFPRFFRWLRERDDVRPVFLLHDLLPLDYPEYFKAGYHDRFTRRFETVSRHAAALIVASHSVARRAAREFEARGRPMVPVRVQPLPSSLPDAKAAFDASLASIPYFVVLGTIEPRKNHLLLLNLWRRLAQEHPSPPKLAIVGARGWENEQAFDALERSHLLRPYVLESSSLGDAGLVRLIRNARAVLMPSFAEGYGLPVVEALSAGTPVVASDIPVFHEIAQGRAIYRHPLDGPGWRQAIEALSDPASQLAVRAKAEAQAFRPPSWPEYFSGVEEFLKGL